LNNPLEQISRWFEEERISGNSFPQGAVLSTVSKDGIPRSRVVGTMLGEDNVPKFFTSPSSRKIEDFAVSKKAALTYSYQHSVRSISIEGCIDELSTDELNIDWRKHDADFRKHYVVFGPKSGRVIENYNDLREIRDSLKSQDYDARPDSFIGFKFSTINRVSFYSVKEGDFAVNDVYNWDESESKWNHKLLIP